MFQVTTMNLYDLKKDETGSIDYSNDFFGKQASLTVSGQLEGELAAMSMGSIYTFGPTFRAERNSHSRFSGKHIQGNTSGLGKAHSDFRKSGPLGSARRVSYEFRPHSTCPRNRLAPEHGMGNLHRRCYQETE
jgi:hypothetical protein